MAMTRERLKEVTVRTTVRAAAAAALLLLFVCASGCVRGAPLRVLTAPPAAGYATLGMVSGQGPNEQSAINHAVSQARQLDADAIIIVHRQPRGRQVWITARAIRFHRRPVSY